MIPALQGFNFGGGVNPYMSRVATYFLRDHLEEHVKLLIDVYRDKRDAMLRGLREELDGTDAEISKPEGGFFIWIKLPTGTDTQGAGQVGRRGERRVACRATASCRTAAASEFARLAYSYESGGEVLRRCAPSRQAIRGAMR